MDASRAATGMLLVFATSAVRFITGSFLPSKSSSSCTHVQKLYCMAKDGTARHKTPPAYENTRHDVSRAFREIKPRDKESGAARRGGGSA